MNIADPRMANARLIDQIVEDPARTAFQEMRLSKGQLLGRELSSFGRARFETNWQAAALIVHSGHLGCVSLIFLKASFALRLAGSRVKALS